MSQLVTGLLAAVFALVFATQASADRIRFCVHINAEYSDSCQGSSTRAGDGVCRTGVETEDYWADRYFDWRFDERDYPRPLTVASDRARFQAFRGGYAQIYERTSSRSIRLLHAGYLGDGSAGSVGCTGWLSPLSAGGDYLFRLYSQGRVRGIHYKAVRNNGTVERADFSRSFIQSADGTTQRVYLFTGKYPGDSRASSGEILERRIFQAGNALAFSIGRDRLGLSGPLRIALRMGTDGGTAHGCDDGTTIFWGSVPHDECIGITGNGERGTDFPVSYDSKSLVSHELGHVLLKRVLGDTPPVHYEYDGASGSCPSGDGHRQSSLEYGTAAVWEGFAHAYATKVWNRPQEGEAIFPSYNGGFVDMDEGDANYVERYMENECRSSSTTSLQGLGNEVDWARTFWEVHSCQGATAATSLRAIAGFIDRAAGDFWWRWGPRDAFARLDREITRDRIYPTLRDCWNTHKRVNGIDH